MKKIIKNTILLAFILVMISSCKKECLYTPSTCGEVCNNIENFEDDTTGSLGNWFKINARAASSIILLGGTNVLFAEDAGGASWVYNKVDFPKELIGTDLFSKDCELQYDVQYLAGSSNLASTDNSITVFQGPSPAAATLSASFLLKAPNLINSGDPMKTITVPLEFASGTTLPSNVYGDWVMLGGPIYTAAQIADFNTLMLNNDGIGFFLDEGGNPAEKWYYDNFCIKRCCLSN